MYIYKRSEITADTLKQWEYNSQFDLVYTSAPTIFDLSMMISEENEDGKVELREDGRVLIDGFAAGRWRKIGDEFQYYTPGQGALSGRVIRS